jgi:hypothetical protein
MDINSLPRVRIFYKTKKKKTKEIELILFLAIQHNQETDKNSMPDVLIHPPDDNDTKST